MSTLLSHSQAWADRYRVSVALLDDEQARYPLPSWVDVVQLDSRGSLLRSLRQLGATVRAVRPDVTVSFLVRANLVTTALSLRRGHAAVISERAQTSGHFPAGVRSRVSKAMVRALYPRADRVIAVSAGVAEDLTANFGVAPERVATIGNPVDVDRVRSRAAEAPQVQPPRPYAVAIGRFTRGKNQRLLLEAFRDAPPDLHLVLLGTGPEWDALHAQVLAAGLQDRVTFAGFVSNPYAVLRGAAFYVSASNGEGFPNALAESLALGIPSIHTNCAAGPSELLEGRAREQVQGLSVGDSGILVPTDDLPGLRHAIALMCRPEVREALAAGARRRGELLGVTGACEQYWRVVASVL